MHIPTQSRSPSFEIEDLNFLKFSLLDEKTDILLFDFSHCLRQVKHTCGLDSVHKPLERGLSFTPSLRIIFLSTFPGGRGWPRFWGQVTVKIQAFPGAPLTDSVPDSTVSRRVKNSKPVFELWLCNFTIYVTLYKSLTFPGFPLFMCPRGRVTEPASWRYCGIKWNRTSDRLSNATENSSSLIFFFFFWS